MELLECSNNEPLSLEHSQKKKIVEHSQKELRNSSNKSWKNNKDDLRAKALQAIPEEFHEEKILKGTLKDRRRSSR